MFNKKILLLLLLSLFVMEGTHAASRERLKPYILASERPGTLATAVARAVDDLRDAGFDIAGQYAPYPGAHVIVVTSDELKEYAKGPTIGGVFAAGQRVGLTAVGDNVQVAFSNPKYMAIAYRMIVDLDDILRQLQGALGEGKPYGSLRGLRPRKLSKYHYAFGMEYFDDFLELGQHNSYRDAVREVERNLKAKKKGASKVYRIDIPGREASVFGVRMTQGYSADKKIMSVIDVGAIRHTPHLPYELVVEEGRIIALHPRFRIAIGWPDMKMMGDNSFVKIMSAPTNIREALTTIGGGAFDDDGDDDDGWELDSE